MKFGMVIGVCIQQTIQNLCIAHARQFSRPDTEIIVLYNGCGEVCTLPPNVEVMKRENMIGREQGLWVDGLKIAQQRGWDWFVNIHDDFNILEAGWEENVEKAAAKYRIGIAGWCTYPYASENGITGARPEDSNLKTPMHVTVDGCGICFNVDLFTHRGFVTDMDEKCGYGEYEAGFWCIQHGYGIHHIEKNSGHFAGLANIPNTRTLLHLGAGGHQDTYHRYTNAKLLPVWSVNDSSIMTASGPMDFTRHPEDPFDVISDAAKSNKGWQCHYGEFYDKVLGWHRDAFMKIMEIGVHEGWSMTLWKNYFHKAKIYGVDIVDVCQRFSDDRVKIITEDANNIEKMKNYGKEFGPFDVVVDDASHIPTQQIATFTALFPALVSNGIYIIEDIPPADPHMNLLVGVPENEVRKIERFHAKDLDIVFVWKK